MLSTYEQIRSAVIEKKQVIAVYKGLIRELCPHAIGRKNGREQAIFFQFGGQSSSGLANPENNWRCLPLDQLQILEIRDGDWHTAFNHSRPSSCIDWIDVKAV